MKVFKGIGFTIIAIFLAGLFLPSQTHVERSVSINATSSEVFSYINDFRKFNLWSPWFRKDPDALFVFSGPETGVGSTMSWESQHEEVGTGSQTIIASVLDERVDVELDFGEQGKALAFYTLEPINEATSITWHFEIDHGWNLISRFFGLMMDGMVGPMYEDGLANLKTLIETPVPPQIVDPNTQG